MSAPVSVPFGQAVRSLAASACFAAAGGAAAAATAADPRTDGLAFFENRVRPVLMEHCYPCHSAEAKKIGGSFTLDTREGLLKGGIDGVVVVPGDPDASLLIKAVHQSDPELKMPPPKSGRPKLPDAAIADLTAWVKMGAPSPETPAGPAARAARIPWSFSPIQDPAPPPVRDAGWARTSVDPFILAEIEAHGLHPAPPAEKLPLLRRVTYDLTGLPPTPGEADEFLADSSAEAFSKVVDRLLASPAYGEHWGRHWLDVARYADTAGDTADYPLPEAWRYRNYVIDSFNADKPYDQFLREQIAGDILARESPPEQYAEQVTATGYLALSRRFGFDSENYQHLTIQDTLDTIGQSFLGLTVGCARCHDHKFDPVTTRDYYGLYGIFAGTRYAFPGSEQKARCRSLTPLVSEAESREKWREMQAGFAALEVKPEAVLRSLDDMDGDFEMQRAASGGSNGVLVPPWFYEGKVSVTQSAQSPFRHVYPFGGAGAAIAPGGDYAIWQQFHPALTNGMVYVNLEFRAAASDPAAQGRHRFVLGASDAPLVEALITRDSVTLSTGRTPGGSGGAAAGEGEDNGSAETGQQTVPLTTPGEWQCLQLAIDLQARTCSGSAGTPGQVSGFGPLPLRISPLSTPNGIETILNRLTLDSQAAGPDPLPSLEIDNAAVSPAPLPPVSTNPAIGSASAALKNNSSDSTARQQRLAVLNRQLDEGPVPMAYAVSEGTPQSVHLQIRGEPDKPGALVPRGFIQSLGHAGLPQETTGSGRRELADWLTRSANPLTARVMANRLWQYHFGRGLVATPNDFGTRSAPPTHPALLDHLATEFMRSGWSVKAMHRLILLSATWRQSSIADQSSNPASPTEAATAREWYAVFPRLRLSAEEIRDAILVTSGTLDSTPGTGHPFPPAHTWSYTQHAPFTAVYDHNKRSVYLMVQRIKRHPFLALFDGADPNASTADRRITTVPTQALYFLNDPFVHDKSRKLAARLQAASAEPAVQVALATRLTLGRPPTAEEQTEAADFLTAYHQEAGPDATSLDAMAAWVRTLFGSNEFLHCD